MDERHWWIAYKVQESFQIGGSTNPSLLESFMATSETLDVVNSFFYPNGNNKLFLYISSNSEFSYTIDDLRISSEIYDVINDNSSKVVYFIRKEANKPVTIQGLEKEVISGELKQNLLHQFSSTLSQVFLPLLKVHDQWGFAPSDAQRTLTSSLEKLSSDFQNASEGAAPPAKQYIIQQPSEQLCGRLVL